MQGTILLVGCGKMGGALLDGWFKRGLSPVDAIVVEPAGRASVAACSDHRALTVLPHMKDVPGDFRPDVILFAIKPQVADQVVPSYRSFSSQRPVFLSVLAGKRTSYFQKHLGEEASVVRAMPNTPAAVGKAISVLYASSNVSEVQSRVCELLMSAVGQVTWIGDESQMDAVTAVSGSGPAYVFLLAECLRDAGIEAGLSADLAAQLARATVAGAGALLEAGTVDPGVLRKDVTSPGGTTAAALEVLMADDGMRSLLVRAVAAATKRSKDLAG